MNLKEILQKINSIEYDIEETSNIVSIEFYTDGSGHICSSDHYYFEFEQLKDLNEFLKLDNEYIIRNRKRFLS